jgi:hypothetical protein
MPSTFHQERDTPMSQYLAHNPFVWVTVIDPGAGEQFLGLHDETDNVDFIPVFLEKDDALKCYHFMARDPGRKYEVQAMRYLELCRTAQTNGFLVFLLDGDGRVIEKQAAPDI